MTKSYRVEITRLAEQDIDAIRRFIAQDKPRAASKWVREIRRQAKSLSRFPERHEVIPESIDLGIGYRHILHGAYRTHYRIDGDRVVVIRVVHGAQVIDRTVIHGPDR